METLSVDGVGEMEAFYSDGLRTALSTLAEIPEMGEKTLRWPGHVEAVRPLVESGRFLEEFRARCSATPPADLVALLVRARWGQRESRALLIDRYDAASGMTAMARTTALTTSAVAQLVASGFPIESGVRPLELIAREPGATDRILAALGRHGVHVTIGDPKPVG
ncbi:MAG: hypothetical protein HYR73_09055 [Candidatus Eisenbacteria bacterium]|nr:hypothetical protein [Candidatus Eisenbacteria bacterium]